MSEQSPMNLAALLEESGLMERAVKIDDAIYRLHWGSAEVLVALTEHALAVSAPLFKELPAGKECAFFAHLLQLNGTLGGVASFALQPDGWVVLHAGRSVKGMDTQELRTIVTAVGELADHYDDQLYHDFYAPPVDTLATEEASAAGTEGGGQDEGQSDGAGEAPAS